jgi:RNA polymerase sigma factor (sigma-70 family)
VNEKYEAYSRNPTSENFSYLVRATQEYAQKIGRLAFSYLHESQYLHACESAAENTMLDLKKFDPQRASFSTWAYQSIYRDLTDWSRKRTRRLRVHAEYAAMPTSNPLPSDDKFLLEQILSSLSEDERELLRLKADESSLEEMAAHFGVSIATIKRRWCAVIEKSRSTLLG